MKWLIAIFIFIAPFAGNAAFSDAGLSCGNDAMCGSGHCVAGVCASGRSINESCSNADDCEGGLICDAGTCMALPGGIGCQSTSDCGTGETCNVDTNQCQTEETPEPILEQPPFEPTLPRFQIPIPNLQPFTKAAVTQTTEGENVFLNINLIGPYLIALYRYLVGISGVVAGLIIVWAGVTWLISGGNPEHINDAKKKIGNAIIGLFLIVGSYVILNIVNPALTVFKPLRIKSVEREALIYENPYIPSGNGDAPAGTFDSLFQKYANCAGIDWRVLRMIAQKESGLRPGYINSAGFIGLFQAKPQYCGLPEQYKDRCTNEQLVNPAVGIAVGMLKVKKAVKLINDYCSEGDARVQFTILYGSNSSGAGGMKAALVYAQSHGGCTVDNVRRGLMEFWKSYQSPTCGGTCTAWFIRYHGANRCADYPDPRDCMGGEKYNYTLGAADAYIAQGGGGVIVPASGPCPLDTADPFPAS